MGLIQLGKKDQGVYLLGIRVNQDINLIIGRLHPEPIPISKGKYLYVGSARGKHNLLYNRLERHTRRINGSAHIISKGFIEKPKATKKFHWHIDYLLEPLEVDLIDIISIGTKNITEGYLVELIQEFPDISIPIPGFGSSDTPYSSHLFKIPDNTEWWDKLTNKFRNLVG